MADTLLPYPGRAHGRRALDRLRRLDADWTAATVGAWLGIPAREVTSDRHADRVAALAQRAEWRAATGGAQCPGATPDDVARMRGGV